MKYLNVEGGVVTQKQGNQTSAGAADAGKLIATNASGVLDETMLPAGVGPLVKSVVTSENLAARDMVNLWNDGGTLKARKADANNAMPANGYVKDAATSPAAVNVYFDGIISGFSGLTPGARYFLSETAGEITATPPSAAASLVQFIGIAISATEIEFDPSDYIVLV